jgi:fatty acid-binding protein DegV
MIKIIIDSACDNKEIKSEKISIRSVPLTIDIDDKAYVDDERLNMPEFLSHMKKMTTFKTACPSPELYEDEFVGEEDIIVLTISSKLSASYQSALISKDSYIEKHGDHKRIHIIDSPFLTMYIF